MKKTIPMCAFSVCAICAAAFLAMVPSLLVADTPADLSGIGIQGGSVYLATTSTNEFIVERKTTSSDWETVGLFTTAPNTDSEWFRTITLQGGRNSVALDDALIFTPGSAYPSSDINPFGNNGCWTLIGQNLGVDSFVYAPLLRQSAPSDAPAAAGNNHATATPQPGTAVAYWQSTSGSTAFWQVNTSGVRRGSGNIYTVSVPSDWTMRAMGDINADGRPELFWQAVSGATATWFMDPDYYRCRSVIMHGSSVPSDWTMRACGDVNGDGRPELFWQATSGATATWFLDTNGVRTVSRSMHGVSVPSDWTLRAAGDVNGDGRVEIFWQAASGATATWFLDTNGVRTVSRAMHSVSVPSDWTLRAAGDVNSDGRSEIFWQATSGATATWFLDTNGVRTVSRSMHSASVPSDWTIRTAADCDGDGRSEIFWQATSGATATWFLDTNGVRTVSRSMYGVSVPSDWTMRGSSD